MIREFNIKDISDKVTEISVIVNNTLFHWNIYTKQLEEFIHTGNFNVITNNFRREVLEQVLFFEYFN